MTTRWLLTLMTVFLGAASVACEPSTAERPKFKVVFEVKSDDGVGLQGATVKSGELELGTTSGSGTFERTLSGAEGQTFPLEIACPEGYVRPQDPLDLRLTRTRRIGADESQPLLVQAVCLRQERQVVVVVHAQNEPDLPVHVEGKPVATTDSEGLAHVRIPVDREVSSLNLSLDTSGDGTLNPRNPTRIVSLEGTDAVVLFKQAFARAKPVVRKPNRAASTRHIPYRVD